MVLTVGQISPQVSQQVYQQMPSFKGENATEIIKQREVKNGGSKLGATLACLGTLGAGAVATAYAFKKGKLVGKLAGLKEGKAAGIKIGEANAAKAAETVSKPITSKPIAQKIHIKSREMTKIKPVVFTRPDGTNIAATQISERLYFSNGKYKFIRTVMDEDGIILSKKVVPRKSGMDLVRKEIVIENGQKVTKKYIYRDGKLASVESSTFDAKTGIIKTVTEHSSGNVNLTQRTKDRYGDKLEILKDKDGNIISCDLRYIDDVGRYVYDLKEAKDVIKRLNIPFEI